METTELEVPQTMHIEAEPVEAPSSQEPDPAPQEPRQRSKRDEMMESILANREKARERELAYGAQKLAEAGQNDISDGVSPGDGGEAEGSGDSSPAEGRPGSVETVPARATQAPKVSPPSAAPAAPEPRRHRIDLGGAQFEVDDAQLLHLARVGAIANQAMANAQQAQPAPQQAPKPAAPQPILDDDEAKAAIHRIQYGDEADAAKALQHVISQAVTRGTPRIDQNALVQHATQQALQHMTVQQNLETIGREYPEIFNDSTLSQLAALKLHEIRQRDAALRVQKSDIELYREACTRVRDAIAPRAPQLQSGADPASVAPQAAPANDRLDRKRAAPRNPSAVDRRAHAESAPRPPSGGEIVEAMRKARGQLQMRA